MTNKYLIRVSIYFIFVLQSFCYTSGIKKEIAEDLKKIKETNVNYLQEESLFLSGRDSELMDPELKKLAVSPVYQNYKKSIQDYWTFYSSKISSPLKSWSDANVPQTHSKTVLYSFSGPDFPNAYTLYPDADLYILMGLEGSGFDPDLSHMSPADLNQGLTTLSQGLVSISKLNFFRTLSMAREITLSKLKGTLPVFLTYFGLLGLEPLAIKHFVFNQDGTIHYLSISEIESNNRYRMGLFSTEIFFRTKDGIVKKLMFLSGDISNPGIEKDPGAMNFLKQLPRSLATMKAASYLVHSEKYTQIRDLLLDKAELFVMDDTGPRIIDLEKNWNIHVYGKYTRPITLFSGRYQKELTELHNQQNPEKINFRFGYGCYDGNHHIMLVTRK